MSILYTAHRQWRVRQCCSGQSLAATCRHPLNHVHNPYMLVNHHKLLTHQCFDSKDQPSSTAVFCLFRQLKLMASCAKPLHAQKEKLHAVYIKPMVCIQTLACTEPVVHRQTPTTQTRLINGQEKRTGIVARTVVSETCYTDI